MSYGPEAGGSGGGEKKSSLQKGFESFIVFLTLIPSLNHVVSHIDYYLKAVAEANA